jgi:ribosomal protein L32
MDTKPKEEKTKRKDKKNLFFFKGEKLTHPWPEIKGSGCKKCPESSIITICRKWPVITSLSRRRMRRSGSSFKHATHFSTQFVTTQKRTLLGSDRVLRMSFFRVGSPLSCGHVRRPHSIVLPAHHTIVAMTPIQQILR